NDVVIFSVVLLVCVCADAVVDGVRVRNQGKGKAGAAEEPMAEWERELLESGQAEEATEQTEEAADQTASPVDEETVETAEAVGATPEGEQPVAKEDH